MRKTSDIRDDLVILPKSSSSGELVAVGLAPGAASAASLVSRSWGGGESWAKVVEDFPFFVGVVIGGEVALDFLDRRGRGGVTGATLSASSGWVTILVVLLDSRSGMSVSAMSVSGGISSSMNSSWGASVGDDVSSIGCVMVMSSIAWGLLEWVGDSTGDMLYDFGGDFGEIDFLEEDSNVACTVILDGDPKLWEGGLKFVDELVVVVVVELIDIRCKLFDLTVRFDLLNDFLRTKRLLLKNVFHPLSFVAVLFGGVVGLLGWEDVSRKADPSVYCFWRWKYGLEERSGA